ncbi:MAG: pyridoxamine 5'-phosphate oxidase family protein [Clostridia bacterium]|nr:pyridoxamine 5'-phosphate oxidase family protein [Clostridia bacterium]
MTKEELIEFISKQKTAFIASVNGQGQPVIRAMLAPRIIDGNQIFFSTNASSNKVKQYSANNKACVYFYKRGKIKYQGVSITGEMQVCTDQATKDKVWRFGDRLFYKQGVTDPDYCVLKFTCERAEYYCDFKITTINFTE